MIEQKQLSVLGNRLFRQTSGIRIADTVLERDYCISWFLSGLSAAPLGAKIAFKGGTSIKKCYVLDYRFSEDLDFTLLQEISFEELLTELEPVFDYVKKNSGIEMSFAREDSTSHKNSYTFYLFYNGPLPKIKPKEIKVDVTIKEELVDYLKLNRILSYDEYLDVPRETEVRCYSPDEIAAEKITALFDKARNEARDLYDIWYLLSNGMIDLDGLNNKVQRKLKFRGKSLDSVKGEFEEKENRLKKLWKLRLSHQISNLPEFDEIYRFVKREFRKAELTDK
jgi:hypothetical protein